MILFYRYMALSRLGEEVVGVIRGPKNRVERIAEQNNLKIIEIGVDIKSSMSNMVASKKLPNAQLIEFLTDFSSMYERGLTIGEILDTLKDTTNNLVLKKALPMISSDILNGGTLKSSFKKTNIFPKLVISNIDAGENSGNLPEVFESLVEYYKFKDEIKHSVLSACSYPLFIMSLLMVAVYIFSTNIIPSFMEHLPKESFNNFSTKCVLSISYIIVNHSYILILVPLIVISAFYYLIKNQKEMTFKHIFKIPFVGNLVKYVQLSNMFLKLYTYQKAGILITDSIVKINHEEDSYISNVFMKVREDILKGSAIWEAVGKQNYFPKYVSYSIKRGEKQSELPAYFKQIYGYYALAVRRSVSKVPKLIGYALLLLGGLFVGIVARSFLVPVYETINAF